MTKEKYKEYIQNEHGRVLKEISGLHELPNVLKSLSNYNIDCIETIQDIYNDKDVDFESYLELNELISDNLKEVCRIVKNS
jgi:hypothetical protein